MSEDKRYPNPEDLDLPDAGDPSPDAMFYLGWVVQHARLWVACTVLITLLAASLALNLFQLKTYEPSTEFVDLNSGYPVIVNAEGEVEVDGTLYRPVHMRAVVQSFIENRYGYNWQNLQKINRAIEFMAPSAVDIEREKIREADLGNRVYNARATWDLAIDMSAWKVQALGSGQFKVTVPGTAYILDNFRHTDPENPFPKRFTADLTVRTTTISDSNPFGYEIVETGRDIIY